MKRGCRTLVLLLVAIGGAFIAGDRARGFSFFQSGGFIVLWPGAQSLRYLSPSTFPPGSDPDNHILAAMGLWNSVPASDFVYSYSRLDQDYPIDHFDGFSDTAAVPASALDPGVLAATYLVNDGGLWFDMDLEFSDLPDGVGWTFNANPDCDVISNPTAGNGFSFLLVATHELGHALGLGHDPFGNEPPSTPWFVATLNPSYPAGGPVGHNNIIELHSDDRAGARFLYPHSGPSGPSIPDLATASYATGGIVGKVIPLFFSPDVVLPQDELIARSVIENFGTTNEFFVRQGFYLSADPIIETNDLLLGTLLWDLAFEDAFEFDAIIELPADLPARSYYLGSILDDLDQVAELYEDNNAASYCQPITVARLAPAINTLEQQAAPCGQPFFGPTPIVTHPLNMSPITWSLDNAEPGMTVDPGTGVISWPDPVPSPFLYTIHLRATNSTGTSTQVVFVGVSVSVPQVFPIPDESVRCEKIYAGPTPALTDPDCMNPVTAWSLDAGPAGMTIDGATGVVTWNDPDSSPMPYTITIRAANASGSGTTTWHLLYTRDGDLNRDGTVNLLDFATFASCFGGSEAAPSPDCAADDFACSDLDGSGFIDLADFAFFATVFGS